MATSGGTYEDTWDCGAINGGRVYCSSSTNELLVDPPVMYREWNFVTEIMDGAVQVSDYGISQAQAQQPGIVERTFTGEAGTIENPSDCRPMHLYIDAGIQHALFTVDAGADSNNDTSVGDIQIESYYNISGDITALNQVGGHQHWGAAARGGNDVREIYRMDTSGAFLDLPAKPNGRGQFILPAGGSATFTPIGKLVVIRYRTTGEGKVQLENWRLSTRIRGWAGP